MIANPSYWSRVVELANTPGEIDDTDPAAPDARELRELRRLYAQDDDAWREPAARMLRGGLPEASIKYSAPPSIRQPPDVPRKFSNAEDAADYMNRIDAGIAADQVAATRHASLERLRAEERARIAAEQAAEERAREVADAEARAESLRDAHLTSSLDALRKSLKATSSARPAEVADLLRTILSAREDV